MIIYGDGNTWPWVKAQHILWVDQVLSDKNHPRYAVYYHRFVAEGNLALLRNDERTYMGKWTKAETCQITADLYDICLFLFTVPKGSDAITRHAVRGNWNSPHRFMMFVNGNHYEACRPLVIRISEYRVPRFPNEIQTDRTSAVDGVEYEIELPNVLHFERKPRFGIWPPRVYEQLIPRPVIPVPSLKDLHLAIGATGRIPSTATPKPAEKPILVQTSPIASHKSKKSKDISATRPKVDEVIAVTSSSSDDDEEDSGSQRKKTRRDERSKVYSTWSRTDLRAKAKELRLNLSLYYKKDANAIIDSILNEEDDQDERDAQWGWRKSRGERLDVYYGWPMRKLGELAKSFFLTPSGFQFKKDLINAILDAEDAAESEISAKVRVGQELRTWNMYMGLPKRNQLSVAESVKIRHCKTWSKEMLADALTTRRAVMNGYHTAPSMGAHPKTPAKILEKREQLTLANYMKTSLSDLRNKMKEFRLPYGEEWEISMFADALTAYDREHESLLPYSPSPASAQIGVLAKTNEDPELFDRGMPTEIQMVEFRNADANQNVEDYGEQRRSYYTERFSAEEWELEREARNLSEGGDTLQVLVWDDMSKLVMAKRRVMGRPVRLELKRKDAPEISEMERKRRKMTERQKLNLLIDPELRNDPEWLKYLDSMDRI